ncbi:class I SAM-dependent methyltransferase [Allonocardiopsis opalescens]|uniref:Methyltransferase family protein n=1 Tax=Allonocardiopsis opalescens TaxID=1144618 RepID=A0A2T0Q0D5_9ACTN|nr:class I SAM-dependent methyltransferase [Allonocardiopsis opalescens]PRX97133.1 methyltransferase family protein [Allonocardiopsis opalescens]
MLAHLSRRDVILIGALLALGAVTAAWAAFGEGSPALAAVLLLQGVVLAGIVLVRRDVIRAVNGNRELGRSLARLDTALASVAKHVKADRGAEERRMLRELDTAQREGFERIGQAVDTLTVRHRTGLNQISADTWSLLNLLRVVDVHHEIPAPGGWAATPQTLLAIVSEVMTRPGAPLVVECGSGTSTVWLATALRQKGAGRVIALDHDEHFAAQTRERLLRAGLADWAEVRHAPLRELSLEGSTAPWYDPAALEGISGVDVLFVDGPPQATGEQARYPAYEMLAEALNDGATVVLDDVDRAEEKRVAERWQKLRPAGRSLEPLRRLDRAQLFAVHRAAAPAR